MAPAATSLYTEPAPTRPALAILGIVLGWLTADLLIPQVDVAARGALIASGIAMSAGLLTGMIAAAAGNLRALFRTEHLLMFGLVFWIVFDAAQAAYPLRGINEREIVRTAFFAVALFAVFVWVGSLLGSVSVPGRRLELFRQDLNVRYLFVAALILFVLGTLKQSIGCQLNPQCLVDSLVAPRGREAWQGQVDFGQWHAIVRHLRFCGFLVLPLAAVLHRLEGRFTWRTLMVTILGLIVVVLMIREGGRRGLGTIIGATFLVWILLKPRITRKHLLALAAGAAGILLVMQAMVAWRYSGFYESLAEGRDLELKGRHGIIDIDQNLRFLCHIIRLVPESVAHTGMDGVLHHVLAPIPRSIIPWKPFAGIPLPELLDLKVTEGYSWTASAIGDLYLIGGLLAVCVGGLLFGALANLCNRLLALGTVTGIAAYGAGAMALFVGLRTVTEVILTGFAFGALVLVLVARRIFTRRTIHRPLFTPLHGGRRPG